MRRVRKKVGCKEKVFGCDLMEHLTATAQEVPQVLRSCSEFIEEHGVVDGIYRLSGVSSNTQKLRSEFDSEGNPELRKDLYLQDIHCVSSLCKAYFRELPNPLLTYQLYDRFAEAVAVQLEDERLVKIRDVLRDLPPPHFRTLEFLMRHLVKMSTFSSETNMHARNLAIVWAPNLLRSKDIEASGFNGTAAFMEVRVQSIVVEFILTHVPQLFPDIALGVPAERRKSLPSPTILSNQAPFQYPGNMSPGYGPPPVRPSYHAIIEPSDKRKGSLKGRKWKSIFNLGGRLPDPRKRNKGSTKEKEKQALRPAKSMDSLSPGPYEGNRQAASPTQLSPATPIGADVGGASGGGGDGGVSSGLTSGSYAVTFRRGGGVSVGSGVSGGGTQGTYSRLESAGGGTSSGGRGGAGTGSDTGRAGPGGASGGGLSRSGSGSVSGSAPVSRSPALSNNNRGKRDGMHISGPFSVTVPLHITSGLHRVIQGSRGDEDRPTGHAHTTDHAPATTAADPAPIPALPNDDAPSEVRSGGGETEEVEKEEKKKREGRGEHEDAKTEEMQEQRAAGGGGDASKGEDRKIGVERGEEEEKEEKEEKEEEERDAICNLRKTLETLQFEEEVETSALPVEDKGEDRHEGEQTSVNGQAGCEEDEEDEEEEEEEVQGEEEEEKADPEEICDSDYMDMKCAAMVVCPIPLLPVGGAGPPPCPAAASLAPPEQEPVAMDAELPLDADLPLDFQDTFGFLDMDMMMDCSPPSQSNNEFSVEPPCFEDDEYESQSWFSSEAEPPPPQTQHTPAMAAHPSPHGRLASKSHSLPYKCTPSYPHSSEDDEDEEDEEEDDPILSDASDEDDDDDDDDDDDYGEEHMLHRSLPNALEFHGPAWSTPAGPRDEDPTANSRQDMLTTGQSSQATAQDAALSPLIGGHVDDALVLSQSQQQIDQPFDSASQSEEPGADDHTEALSGEGLLEMAASPGTDASSLANQIEVPLASSQSRCSYAPIDSNDDYMKMSRITDEDGVEMEEEHSEEKTETSCEEQTETQRASESRLHSETAPSPSSNEDFRPPLPIRDYHGNADDSQHTYEVVDVIEDEEGDEEDDDENEYISIAELTAIVGLAAISRRQTETPAGEGCGPQEPQAKSSTTDQEETEQHATESQRDEEKGGMEEKEERNIRGEDGEQGMKSEVGSGVEGGRPEQHTVVHGDGDKGKEWGEEREERRTATVEDYEGSSPPVQDEEEEEEEEREEEEEEKKKGQPGGDEAVSAERAAEETTDRRGDVESDGGRVAAQEEGEGGGAREDGEGGGAREDREGEGAREEHMTEQPGDGQKEREREREGQAREEEEGEGEVKEKEEKHKPVERAEEGQQGKRDRSEDRIGESVAAMAMDLGPGVGSALVTTKQASPRTHQVKAVPVVAPKPQQSRLTALGIMLPGRDPTPPQRDLDTPYSRSHSRSHSLDPTTLLQLDPAHTPDTRPESTDTPHTPHVEAAGQHDTHSSNTEDEEDEDEMAQELPTTDTKSAAAPELTDADAAVHIHTALAHDPNTSSSAPPDTQLPPPQIVIDLPQQTPSGEAEQPQAQQAAHPERSSGEQGSADGERRSGEQGSADGERGVVEEGRGDTDTDTDTQAEHRAMQGEQHGDRGGRRDRRAGRDKSPDSQKDRLPTAREGERERDRERRSRERDVKRNYFDEAVARVTREREKEREHGDRDRGVNVQDENVRL